MILKSEFNINDEVYIENNFDKDAAFFGTVVGISLYGMETANSSPPIIYRVQIKNKLNYETLEIMKENSLMYEKYKDAITFTGFYNSVFRTKEEMLKQRKIMKNKGETQ